MSPLESLLLINQGMRILYAEDDFDLRQMSVSLFEDLHFSVEACENGKCAWEKYEAAPHQYDMIITDLNMPHMNGIELIKRVHTLSPDMPIIIVSAHNETEFFLESIRNTVIGYILKPIDFGQLIETLYKTASLIHLRRENETYKHKLQRMVEEKTVELQKSYQTMHEFLTTDKVTKLQNATMLYHFLDAIPSGSHTCAMLFNIDDFSAINQSYGFEIGDAILYQVGVFLDYNIPEEVHLFKYNSDEFVIIFDTSLLDAASLATQIQAFFKETPVSEYNHEPLYITLSCGISNSKEPQLLLPHARTALKEIQLQGIPNTFNLFESVHPSSEQALMGTTWIQKLRLALEEDRVFPLFHPIVDNQTQNIISYECLARIEEEGCIVTPGSFLEAARRSGLMGNITRTMINKCFKIFADKEIAFSLNITNEDLLNPTFIDFLTLKQRQYGIKPERIVLEILEDIILNDSNHTSLKNLKNFKILGYKIALDDFGSDRSNFNRFEQCGVDYVKIDGQFIKGIDTLERHQNIVESIVFMAHKLGIKVVAEFVSTEAEFLMVKRLGVDYSQGYYFNQPQKLN